MRLRKLFWTVAIAASLVAPEVLGQTVSQTLTLQPGWNAIYLHVSPSATADDFFANWPVPSVSIYNASAIRLGHRFTNSVTDVTAAGQPFYIWTRETTGVSSVGKTVPGDSVLVCFNQSGAVFTVEAQGTPVAPRIAWHDSEESGVFNYVGISLASNSVRVKDYFEGKTFTKVYRYGGTSESDPKALVELKGMNAEIEDGDVLLLPGSDVSTWSGVLNVSPQYGVDFGKTSEISGITVRNDGTESRTVTISYDEGGVTKPTIQYYEDTLVAAPEWKTWEEPLSRTLEAGDSWTLMLALDRSQFTETDAGATVGGILTVTEDGASLMKAQVPLTATAQAMASSYPTGLWIAEVELNKVDRVVSDTTIHRALSAGGRMRFRLILHVDSEGVCKLLQRVTLSGSYAQDGSFSYDLYAGGAVVPSAHEITLRYSCVTLPTDVPVIDATSGTFGATLTGSATDYGATGPAGGLRFDYTIDAKSSSNPFYHPHHPDHDGLDWDFSTELKDGRDFTAYEQTVKPETFSFDGQVLLFWDSNSSEWKPTESVTGSCFWAYGNGTDASADADVGGLRHEGTIWASGTFTMQRISENATLKLE